MEYVLQYSRFKEEQRQHVCLFVGAAATDTNILFVCQETQRSLVSLCPRETNRQKMSFYVLVQQQDIETLCLFACKDKQTKHVFLCVCTAARHTNTLFLSLSGGAPGLSDWVAPLGFRVCALGFRVFLITKRI